MKRTVQRQWVDRALDALQAELRGMDESALRLRANKEFGLSDEQLEGANQENIISLIYRKHFFPKPKVHKGHYDFVNKGSAAGAAAPPRVKPEGTFTEEEMVLLGEENHKVIKIQTHGLGPGDFKHADLKDLEYIYIRGFKEEDPELYYRGKISGNKKYVYDIVFESDKTMREVNLNLPYDIYIQRMD